MNMAAFKNFADVTAADLEFTKTVKANKCIVSRSNQQAAAQLLNKLIELAA